MTSGDPGDTVTTGERADLLATLGQARHFLRFTARDLTDEQARQRTTVSELTLGGLVKHVTRGRAGLGRLHRARPVGRTGLHAR